MRSISHKLVSIVFAASVAAAVPLGVLAANVSFPVDTTVSFSGGDTVTAVGGSTADAFTVSTASATVTVTSGTSSSTFRSLTKDFVIDSSTATAASTCTGSGAILTVTGTGTTTFSLASSQCTGGTAFQSITASGGGSGSPSAPVSGPAAQPPTAAAETARLQAQVNALIAQLNALIAQATARGISLPSGISSGAFRFTRDLSLGTVSDDVRELQKFLNRQGFTVAPTGPGSAGNETTRFGYATRAALKQFQTSKSIPPTGYFGPLTRAAANALLWF